MPINVEHVYFVTCRDCGFRKVAEIGREAACEHLEEVDADGGYPNFNHSVEIIAGFVARSSL